MGARIRPCHGLTVLLAVAEEKRRELRNGLMSCPAVSQQTWGALANHQKREWGGRAGKIHGARGDGAPSSFFFEHVYLIDWLIVVLRPTP